MKRQDIGAGGDIHQEALDRQLGERPLERRRGAPHRAGPGTRSGPPGPRPGAPRDPARGRPRRASEAVHPRAMPPARGRLVELDERAARGGQLPARSRPRTVTRSRAIGARSAARRRERQGCRPGAGQDLLGEHVGALVRVTPRGHDVAGCRPGRPAGHAPGRPARPSQRASPSQTSARPQAICSSTTLGDPLIERPARVVAVPLAGRVSGARRDEVLGAARQGTEGIAAGDGREHRALRATDMGSARDPVGGGGPLTRIARR